jgi:hypothetical protein
MTSLLTTMPVARMLMTLAEVYGALGLGVAVAFLIVGIERVDPAARGAYLFRPLLIPGIVLLWPVVVWRWRALQRTQHSTQNAGTHQKQA